MNQLGKALATLVVWACPTLLGWATGSPDVGHFYVLSAIATAIIWS